MKVKEKVQARKLRSQGLSLNQIANKLSVAKSSVSNWCKDIDLSTEQQLALNKLNPCLNGQMKGAKAMAIKHRKLREQYQEDGKTQAQLWEPLHVAGCMLYWGEGNKSRNTCGLSNTDPNLLLLFQKFIEHYFDVDRDHWKIHIQCHSDNGISISNIENRWLAILNLPKSSLGKTIVDNLSDYSKSKKRNQPYGTCTMYIYRTDVVQHLYGAIKLYGNFDSEFHLD